MSRDTHRLSQYLPSAEMPDPKIEDKPVILARGKDSTLIQTDEGMMIADKNGKRRC